MRWAHRWLRGLAVAALAVAMLGSGFTAGSVRAEDPDHQGEKTNYHDTFFDNLAAALHTDRPTMDNALRQAALETVNQAVLNEDLTQKQGDEISACIQKDQSGGDFMRCFYRQRYHHGQGKEGGTGHGGARTPEPTTPRSQPGMPGGQPGAQGGQQGAPSGGQQQQGGGW